MIYQSGDSNVILDSGSNRPGDILQRKEAGVWKNFMIGGEPVKAPLDFHSLQLPPGQYRVVGPGE